MLCLIASLFLLTDSLSINGGLSLDIPFVLDGISRYDDLMAPYLIGVSHDIPLKVSISIHIYKYDGFNEIPVSWTGYEGKVIHQIAESKGNVTYRIMYNTIEISATVENFNRFLSQMHILVVNPLVIKHVMVIRHDVPHTGVVTVVTRNFFSLRSRDDAYWGRYRFLLIIEPLALVFGIIVFFGLCTVIYQSILYFYGLHVKITKLDIQETSEYSELL